MIEKMTLCEALDKCKAVYIAIRGEETFYLEIEKRRAMQLARSIARTGVPFHLYDDTDLYIG